MGTVQHYTARTATTLATRVANILKKLQYSSHIHKLLSCMHVPIGGSAVHRTENHLQHWQSPHNLSCSFHTDSKFRTVTTRAATTHFLAQQLSTGLETKQHEQVTFMLNGNDRYKRRCLLNWNWSLVLKAKFNQHPSAKKTGFLELLHDRSRTLGKETLFYSQQTSSWS